MTAPRKLYEIRELSDFYKNAAVSEFTHTSRL